MISSYLLCLVTLQTTQTDTAFMILQNRAMNQKWDFEIFIVLNNQYSPQTSTLHALEIYCQFRLKQRNKEM